MPRLHLRFYFSLLGSILVFAVIVLVLWHLDGGGPIHHRIHVLIAMPVIALVVSVLAYPLTRRLTWRLERLQLAVESLGDGNLSARVAVEGNDEVARLAGSFNRAAGRIEDLVGAHMNLLANASHELRTPLARIRLATELMKGSADPKRKAELEQDIAELDLLIDEILLSSRLDAVVELDISEEVDLLGLAAEECARFSNVQLNGSPVVYRGDPRLLRRLLRNLLENAQRHGVPPVEVHLAQKAGSAEIVVCDRGPTIPDDQSTRLFEPFYRRADAVKKVGAGLGLALVRQIAHRHGGTVRYLATKEGLNSFVVTLPM